MDSDRPSGLVPLTDDERRILECEQNWWTIARTKHEAIRELGLSSPQYYLILGRALDKPAAAFEFPELVGRLTRLRERRSAERHG